MLPESPCGPNYSDYLTASDTIKIKNFALARSLPLARSRCSSCDFLLIFDSRTPMIYGPLGFNVAPWGPGVEITPGAPVGTPLGPH